MRIIKYRALDKICNRMFQVATISFIHKFVDEGIADMGYQVLREFPLDDVILMQFTGASDKHGTEIYEGDIIKYGDTVGTIKWSVDDTKFYISAHAQNTEFNNGIWRLSIGRDSHLIEVIGNIYEKQCDHEYITVSNEVVTGTTFCKKCNLLSQGEPE